jgi:uncharacterized coiled-coil protein SlyX
VSKALFFALLCPVFAAGQQAADPPKKDAASAAPAQQAVTVDQLKARLAKLEAARDQETANLNALLGRIAEVQDLIDQAAKPAEKQGDAGPPK